MADPKATAEIPCSKIAAVYTRRKTRYRYWKNDRKNTPVRRRFMLIYLRPFVTAARIRKERCERANRDPEGLGVDYAFTPHPSIGALKKAGAKFVARYLSNVDPRDPTATKTLGVSEARALRQADIPIVLVFETTAARAGAGRAAGVADARTAEKHAGILGATEDTVLYFAVDYDASPRDVEPYFEGVGSVLPDERVGVYGGLRVVRDLLDRKLVAHAWQTRAWSVVDGKVTWDPRAGIQQYEIETTIGGCDVDLNRATRSDYGAWG